MDHEGDIGNYLKFINPRKNNVYKVDLLSDNNNKSW